MKVKEIIEILKNVNPEAEVYLFNEDDWDVEESREVIGYVNSEREKGRIRDKWNEVSVENSTQIVIY